MRSLQSKNRHGGAVLPAPVRLVGWALLVLSCSRSTPADEAAVSAFMAVSPPPPVAEPEYAPSLLTPFARSLPPQGSVPEPSASGPREPFRPSSRCDSYPESIDAWDIPDPSWAHGMTYRQALKQSKQTAKDEGFKHKNRLELQAGVASVEVYSHSSEGEYETVMLDVVAAGYEPWTIEGFDYSDVKSLILPNGESGPRVAELSVSACPYASCMGCSPAVWGLTIYVQWYGGELSVVPWGNPAGANFRDVDDDGLLELGTAEASVGLDTCGGRWCCGAHQVFQIDTYLGWEDGCWRRDLPRFAQAYLLQLSLARGEAAKRRAGDRSDPTVRCALASYATSVYWLEVLLGGDREQQRRQWGADLASYSPPECYDEEMHDIVDSADEVRRRVLGVPIVKLDRVAAALKSLPPPAAASAASTAAPSTSRVAPSGSAAQRVPLP